MSNKAPLSRGKRRLAAALKQELRALTNQVSLLNRRVVARVDVRDVDLDCFEVIARHGPLSPSALSRRAGLHPATITGILDRLQRGGWIARERDDIDRRAVTVRALRDRNAELLGHYAGMNTAMDDICAGYSDAELELITDFLRQATEAGQDASATLADEG
ncbi:MAG: MarR family transcriptional regulator [Propionibacteriaceae bacterium]